MAIGTYARTGGPAKTEDDPRDPDLPAEGRPGADAIRHLEDTVTGADGIDGIVLRYGAFYGPGTGISADHDAFDHPYDQIATIVATSEDNARQLVARARRHVDQRRPRFEPSRQRREHLARRFFAAARDGDLGALEALLAHDVTLHGGGLPRPVTGRVRVARLLRAGLRQAATLLGHLFLDPADGLIAVVALDITEGGQIQTVTSVSDPDKLRHLGPLAEEPR